MNACRGLFIERKPPALRTHQEDLIQHVFGHVKKRHKNSRDFILTSSFHLLFVYYMNYLYIISTRQMGRWSIVFFWSTGARLFLDYSKRETMEWQKNLAKVAETWHLPTRANCFLFFWGLSKILHYFIFYIVRTTLCSKICWNGKKLYGFQKDRLLVKAPAQLEFHFNALFLWAAM